MQARLHHVQLALPAGAEDVARAFYAGVLGMQEMQKPAALVRRGGCWFRAGELELHLGVDPDFRSARKAHPGIVVENVDVVAADLVDAGLEVEWDEAFPGHRRFYVSDPFGNRLEFLQPVVAPSEIRYERLNPQTVDHWRPEVVATYAEAFTEPPYNRNAAQVDHFAGVLQGDARRTGYVGVAARVNGALAGFTYGYTTAPHQWWHEQVRPVLGPLADTWLHDAFEYVELAVRPRFRRLGIGRELHNRLLAAQEHRRAVLSTLDEVTAGRRLYEAAGWAVLARNVRFARTTMRYVIMGRELAAPSGSEA